ncbi:MAG: hypothetical protein HY738_15175 [Bacteroidia bacterium]|nr:hypothetical protein [Bacteroidia bacterium]
MENSVIQTLPENYQNDIRKAISILFESGCEKKSLSIYLVFRHFFKHTYVFYYDWDKMKILAADIETVFKEFMKKIKAFFKMP